MVGHCGTYMEKPCRTSAEAYLEASWFPATALVRCDRDETG